jgi:hypothetical protein
VHARGDRRAGGRPVQHNATIKYDVIRQTRAKKKKKDNLEVENLRISETTGLLNITPK